MPGEIAKNKQTPINSTAPADLAGRHIVVANNGAEFAIYLKEGDSTVGRLFVTIEEMADLVSQYIKTVIDQDLDPGVKCLKKIKDRLK